MTIPVLACETTSLAAPTSYLSTLKYLWVNLKSHIYMTPIVFFYDLVVWISVAAVRVSEIPGIFKYARQ